MNRLLSIELRKGLRFSNLIIILICAQQTFGGLTMDLMFSNKSIVDHYVLLKIVQDHIYPGVYFCIVLLSCVSMSIEIKEKTFAVQLVSGLSRRQFFVGKLFFFYLTGIILSVFSVGLMLLNLDLASSFDFILLAFKQGIVLSYLIVSAIFVLLGLIIGRFLMPILSIGVVVLYVLIEELVKFFMEMLNYQEAIKYLPIRLLEDSNNTIFIWSIKLGLLVIIWFLARHFFLKRDIPI